MKTLISRCCTSIDMLICFSTAASSINNTKISKVLLGPQFGNNVFLVIETKATSLPSCQTNGVYSYVFDGTTAVGKMTLSAVLSAYAAQRTVTIGGGHGCTLYGNVENLNYILVH